MPNGISIVTGSTYRVCLNRVQPICLHGLYFFQMVEVLWCWGEFHWRGMTQSLVIFLRFTGNYSILSDWVTIEFCTGHNNTGMHRISLRPHSLTQWGRVTHICVGNLTIIGSDNGLSPGRRQAIIWTNVGILLIRPPGANFSEILSEIHTFPLTKMHLKSRLRNGVHFVSASMC